MDEHTERLIEKTQQLFHQFRSRGVTLEELQTGIVGIASAFESSPGRQIGEVLDNLEGDLENIRFMSLPENQETDVLDRITQVEEAIRTVCATED